MAAGYYVTGGFLEIEIGDMAVMQILAICDIMTCWAVSDVYKKVQTMDMTLGECKFQNSFSYFQ